jgi:hypothetical protein
MIKQALLATVLVASFSSFASAQDAPPPPPPGAPQADAGRQGDDHRDRWKEHAEDRRDRRGPGGPEGERRGGPGHDGPRHDRRGPGPEKTLDKGIELKMGRGGASVRIECGDEPMADCLAAAGPMLEKLDRKGGGHGYGRHGGGERPPMGDEGPERQDD